jgi:hypothetical protein
VHFSATNNRGIGRKEDKIVWHDKKREKMTSKVADLFYLQSEDLVILMDTQMNLR